MNRTLNSNSYQNLTASPNLSSNGSGCCTPHQHLLHTTSSSGNIQAQYSPPPPPPIKDRETNLSRSTAVWISLWKFNLVAFACALGICLLVASVILASHLGNAVAVSVFAFHPTRMDVLSAMGYGGSKEKSNIRIAHEESGVGMEFSVPSSSVAEDLSAAIKGDLGSHCIVAQMDTLRPEWKFVWCSFQPACLSGSESDGVLVFPRDEALSALQSTAPPATLKPRLRRATTRGTESERKSDYLGEPPTDNDEVVDEWYMQNVPGDDDKKSYAESEDNPGWSASLDRRKVDVFDVINGEQLIDRVGWPADGQEEFGRAINFTNSTWNEATRGKEILWIDGVALISGKGVNWKSYAHRLQPYFDSLKAWNFYKALHGEEGTVAGPSNPDAMFMLREDFLTDIPQRFVNPALARGMDLLGVDEFFLSKRDSAALGQNVGKVSNSSTVAVTAESISRLQRQLKRQVLVCMRNAVFAMPHSGSQYAPLIVDQSDMKGFHRRQAAFFDSKILAEEYEKGPIPSSNWTDPCQITVVNRRAKNRKISNVPELVSELETFVKSRSFTGAHDEQLLTVVEEAWDGSDLKDYKRIIHHAAESCILITPHGAGLINAMHMRPGSLLIELNPSRYYWPRLRISIAQMGVNVASVWFDVGEEVRSHHNSTVEGLAADNVRRNDLLLNFEEFKISPAKVIGVIENYLLGRMDLRVYSKYHVEAPDASLPWLRTKYDQDTHKAWKAQSLKLFDYRRKQLREERRSSPT